MPVKNYISFTLILFIIFFAASCKQTDQNKNQLIIWTDMNEMNSLDIATKRFTDKTGVQVKIVRVPFLELRTKFQVAAPVRQGPDLITGPHNWIGPFATAKLISSFNLPEEERKKFLNVSLKVMSFDGKPYGLPLSVETMGLIYNKKFIKDPPKTMKELIETAQSLTKGDFSGFLFDNKDFYLAWAIFGGYGAYIFKETPNGLDPLDVGLDTPQAVEAANFILDLQKKYHLMEQGITKDIASGRFMDNKCAMTLNGPWALVDFKKQNIDYGFTQMPKLENGRHLSPLVGVLGIMLNNYSKKRELAIKLMQEITDNKTLVDIYLEGGRIPSRLDAQDDPRIAFESVYKEKYDISYIGGTSCALNTDFIQNNEVKGVLDSASVGTPMPNIPAMALVWQPMKEALELITMEKLSPQEALTQATERIKKDIKRMMK